MCLYIESKGIQGLPGGLPQSCTVGKKCYWQFIHPLPFRCCQALFQVSEQSFVCDLGLPIGLRIPRRRADIINPIHCTELLECFTDELWPVVREERMRYLESTDDVPLKKLDELCFRFRPLGEMISGHQHELPLASS